MTRIPQRVPQHFHTGPNDGGRLRPSGEGGTIVSGGASSGGGAVPTTPATTVEIDLGSSAVWRGKFTITDATIATSKKVLCWQAPGPYTGKGTLADESELQPVSVISVDPLAGSAIVRWQTPPMIVMVPVVPNGKRLTPVNLNEMMLSVRSVPTRRGRVRGNVKFTYLVLG